MRQVVPFADVHFIDLGSHGPGVNPTTLSVRHLSRFRSEGLRCTEAFALLQDRLGPLFATEDLSQPLESNA